MKQLLVTIDNDEQVSSIENYLKNIKGVSVEEDNWLEEQEQELKDKIAKGLHQSNNGEGQSWDEVKKELQQKFNIPAHK